MTMRTSKLRAVARPKPDPHRVATFTLAALIIILFWIGIALLLASAAD